MDRNVREVVIIGSGPAGYTAALYAARAGLKPLVFAGTPSTERPERMAGGQLVTTTSVENFPGFPEGIDGRELMERMRAQAEQHGAEIVEQNVRALEEAQASYRVEGDEDVVSARAVIVATGAAARWLHVPGEDAYRNRGVFACATCDGPLFVGGQVTVVGGGDSALEEALYLARFAAAVRVVHRGSALSASHVMVERARREPKISFVWNSALGAILGDGEHVTAVQLWHGQTGEASELATDAVFVAIGHTPESDLFPPTLVRDAAGYIVTAPRSTETSLPGVFACGDVADARYRQAITAAGSGAMAAIDAQRWLSEQASTRRAA